MDDDNYLFNAVTIQEVTSKFNLTDLEAVHMHDLAIYQVDRTLPVRKPWRVTSMDDDRVIESRRYSFA